ncbi:MAG: biotin/lipoyl-binding protein [Pirellulales bacterium]
MKWILGIAVAVLLVGGLLYASATTGVVVQAAAAKREPIREFVDEQAQTRLPLTHLITMPYDGRIDPITLAEGARVTKGQLVAQVVPIDTQLTLQEAKANIARLEASIKESGDKTVEKTGWKQSLEYVASMKATVDAADARVEAGLAKLDYANKNLRRIRALRETNSASEDQLNSAEVQQVQADVDYRQDQLVLKALQSMMAATVLVPTLVEQYMARKDLSVAVLENEKVQAEVRLRATNEIVPADK